jgi:hypothetical protein
MSTYLPIHHAAIHGDVDGLLDELIRGASTDAEEGNFFGAHQQYMFRGSQARTTPLHLICDRHAEQSFENPHPYARYDETDLANIAILLDAGADPEAVDGGGKTSLVLAMYHERYRLVQLLLDRGADASPEEVFQQVTETHSYLKDMSPLHWAMGIRANIPARELIRVAAALVAAGASLTAEDDLGYGTILEFAIWHEHRRLWPFFFRLGVAHPRNWESMPHPNVAETMYGARRAHPHLLKIDTAGNFQDYNQQHLRSLTAIFSSKLPRLPAEVVPVIVQF